MLYHTKIDMLLRHKALMQIHIFSVRETCQQLIHEAQNIVYSANPNAYHFSVSTQMPETLGETQMKRLR